MNNSDEKILEHIIQRMQSDRSVDAPADALRYANNLYRTRLAEPKQSIIQRVIAVMKMDLAPNRAAFGERSAAGGQARQMLFESADNAIDLRITAAANGFDLRGQVLGDGFEQAEIVLSDGNNSVIAQVDDTGTFRLASISPGEYNLSIKGISSEIFIQSLTLD